MKTAERLSVLYDESCALCRRCRDWLLTQPCLVQVELIPAQSPFARSNYAAVDAWLGKELIVVDDKGHVWVGPAAFLTCLWATARYRSVSYALARPKLAPLAEKFFMMVSKRRDRFGRAPEVKDSDCSWCDEAKVEFDKW